MINDGIIVKQANSLFSITNLGAILFARNLKEFGLGVSLLSTEKSLIEKYGEQKFNELIKQKSKFYDQLF